MLLERTIIQLDTGPMPPDEAREQGQLGYMQWFAALPGHVPYRTAALEAHRKAAPFRDHSPAVAEFCALIMASVENPLTPLPLTLPAKKRRGGAKARRSWRLPL